MKFVNASKDQDGYYNYQVQLDQANVLSPVKSFRYSPFVPINGQTEAQYIAAIELEIQNTSILLKTAWTAQGSPANWIPGILNTTVLPSTGKIV